MTDAPPLTERAAEAWLAAHCFDTGPAGFVGATVELLPVALLPVEAPAGPVFQRLRHGHLGGDYAGVLAVSSPPSPGLDVCVRRTAEDVALARDVLAGNGFAAGERALDPYTGGVVTGAAVKVCVDAGRDGPDLARRWAVAHAVGPVLTAAFANSPLRAGRPTGLRSTRQALISARSASTSTRPGRVTAPASTGTDRPIGPHRMCTGLGRPAGTGRPRDDPRAAWTAQVLDGEFGGPTFRERLRGGRASLADLRRHLDGLPGPVRARGHLELTMIDAQPGDGWRVAVAVAAALVDDARAADEALAATEALAAPEAVGPDAWIRAARDGLSDPALAQAARACFVTAYAALSRQGVARELRDDVADFIHRYVSRARCPADDVLDAVHA